ncbi:MULTISPECIES: PEP-CTERM sorting domain-containing protein [Thalassotalea]|uniref:PEP-CTERM sorting domain-containing protein n=1 Tax=Thalassotalea castellviae TaxID=3075612 RepID=A0ABU3A2N0_9GAMM|nr:PEP-CTERM sorting domain-containing protein [Thalassotalea sp. W431]MDT0604055.1 PEP-CTERM sorting domain-containing protein [Thalassotalea sp. W431]
MIKFNKKILIVIFSIFTHFSTSATIITSDLTVEGSIALGWIDPISGVWVTPETIFTANMSVGSNSGQVNPGGILGGLDVSGDNTSNVAITDTDQKLSFDTTLLSNAAGYEVAALDFSLYIENNHATDTFELDFGFDFFNKVDTWAIPGLGGFSSSLISLYDDSGEFFFSDIMSDVDYGNERNGFLLPTPYGGVVQDSGLFNFSRTLLAGESINIVGVLQASFGFITDSVPPAKQDSTGMLGLNDVRQIQVGQPPVTVPEPSSLLLFLSILLLTTRTKIKRI